MKKKSLIFILFFPRKKSVILLHHGVQNYIMYIHLLVYSVTLESIVECYLLHFENASALCYFHKNFVSLDFLEHVLLYVLRPILIKDCFLHILCIKNTQNFVVESCLIQKWSMHIFICLFIVMFGYFPLAHSQIKPLFRPLVRFFIIFPVDMLTNKGVKRGL
jgi:hypothetical protein